MCGMLASGRYVVLPAMATIRAQGWRQSLAASPGVEQGRSSALPFHAVIDFFRLIQCVRLRCNLVGENNQRQ
jgi:hypothetical protein